MSDVGEPTPASLAGVPMQDVPGSDSTTVLDQLVKANKTLDSIRTMLVFFVWITLAAILLGGIAWIIAAQNSSNSTNGF